jgi:hypothetical protein
VLVLAVQPHGAKGILNPTREESSSLSLLFSAPLAAACNDSLLALAALLSLGGGLKRTGLGARRCGGHVRGQ